MKAPRGSSGLGLYWVLKGLSGPVTWGGADGRWEGREEFLPKQRPEGRARQL